MRGGNRAQIVAHQAAYVVSAADIAGGVAVADGPGVGVSTHQAAFDTVASANVPFGIAAADSPAVPTYQAAGKDTRGGDITLGVAVADTAAIRTG